MKPFCNILLLSGILLFIISLFAKTLGFGNLTVYLYIASIILTGSILFRNASKSLLAKRVDENVLILLAMFGFMCIGKWFEASVAIILFSLNQLVQNFLLKKAPKGYEKVLSYDFPVKIKRLENDQLVECPIELIHPDDILVINSGEILPVDAVVKEGQALTRHAFNFKQIDVHKVKEGDYIFAGSFTVDNRLVVIAQSTIEDSVLNFLQELPNKNQTAMQMQQVNDFSRFYSPIILLSSIFIILIPWHFFAKPLEISLYYGLANMAILTSYPILKAFPVATALATNMALEKNILFKTPFALENTSKANSIAFDKTNTLTSGTLTATNIYAPYPFSQLEILYFTVPLMKSAQSPLAKAFIPQAQDIATPYQAKLEEDTEHGFTGMIENRPVVIGKNSFLEQKGIKTCILLRKYAEYQALGSQALFIAIDGKAAGLIGLRDDIRQEAFAMIRKIQSIGTKNIVMLTSDHENAAAAFTRPLGLASVSNLAHAGKKHIINKLRNQYGNILMIGDPMKDSMLLASADLSIAICNNVNDTKNSLAIADIVLLSNDITKIPEIFSISKDFGKLMSKNTKLMLLSKFICLILIFSSLIDLWAVLLIDIIISSLIILNTTKKFELN